MVLTLQNVKMLMMMQMPQSPQTLSAALRQAEDARLLYLHMHTQHLADTVPKVISCRQPNGLDFILTFCRRPVKEVAPRNAAMMR